MRPQPAPFAFLFALCASACGGKAVECRGLWCDTLDQNPTTAPSSTPPQSVPPSLLDDPVPNAELPDFPRGVEESPTLSRPPDVPPVPQIDEAPDPDGPLPLTVQDTGICTSPNATVSVFNQAQLDQLEGCIGLDASLSIFGFDNADLTPLNQLVVIQGDLSLGQARIGEEEPRGAIRSLNGLQQLSNVVGGLFLHFLEVSSLEALRRVELAADEPTIGLHLGIFHCDNLTNLAGLEGISNLQSVRIEGNENLASLDGLDPRTALEELYLVDNPNLAAGGELTTSIRRGLTIRNTGFISLTSFSSLTRAQVVTIEGNRQLENLQGLANMDRFDELIVRDNSNLVSMPEFGRIDRMKELEITGNPRLVQGPSFPAAIDLASSRADVDISNNTSLVEFNGFQNLQSVRTLSIRSNPQLEALDLSSLERVVRRLDVACNASLPQDVVLPLSSVRTREFDLSGNLDSDGLCPILD